MGADRGQQPPAAAARPAPGAPRPPPCGAGEGVGGGPVVPGGGFWMGAASLPSPRSKKQ